VRYDALKIHSDAGNTAAQRGRLEALAEHLRTLGAQRLPAGQRLEVELIDLDLTGTVRIARHALGEVRVVNGRAGPHIELAYTRAMPAARRWRAGAKRSTTPACRGSASCGRQRR
jgi:hypothetical protein